MTTPAVDNHALPYRIAVLCYLYDADDRVLLLHRNKSPNKGMYSPIGGKLEVALGEGPHDCAKREIMEEAGIDLADEDVRLSGIVSETAYEGQTHWLIFLFEVMRPIAHDEVRAMDMDEGALEWVPSDQVASQPIPETDQRIMWPLVCQHRGGFFMVHIDCTDGALKWTVQERVAPPQGARLKPQA